MPHSPPPAPTPILRRRGTDASRYGQAPPNLHQAFINTDPAQKASDRTGSSSDRRINDTQASEQAFGRRRNVSRPAIQSPTPERSPEPMVAETQRHLTRGTASGDGAAGSVSPPRLSHPGGTPHHLAGSRWKNGERIPASKQDGLSRVGMASRAP